LPEAVSEPPRADERLFHRDLLIEQHPHQQGERVGRQQPIGLLVVGQAHLRHGLPRVGHRPASAASSSRTSRPASGAATLPPEPASSTSTANATSPRAPTNQACSTSPPACAVPVLPSTSGVPSRSAAWPV